MAINDRNHGPRIARNQRAEATWPENLRHLCQYFEGLKFEQVEKRLYKTPKTQLTLLQDLRMKVIEFGYMGTSQELEVEITRLAETFVVHFGIDALVYNCIDAYESVVRRLALMAAFAEEERRFSDMFGIDLEQDKNSGPFSGEALIANGMALLGTVVKDKRQGPPQALSATAGAAAEAAKPH